MDKKQLLIILCLHILLHQSVFPFNDTLKTKEAAKSGFSFGAVPVVAYDSDIGFKYGGLVNFYHYGDGTIYPDYKHSLFFEWSRTTKGSGINNLSYDSKYLIPGIRVSLELSYLTEKGLDFYGFNGYQSFYNSTFEDDSPENTEYHSRVFYKQDRKLLRLRADFKGKINESNFKWIGGLAHYNIKLDTVNVDKLNEDRNEDDDDFLPYTGGGLYGLYKEWKVVATEQYYGGSSTLLKVGLEYDSRDNEPNPMSGLWTELLFIYDPGLINSNHNSYAKYILTHRQYFTIIPKKLSFVYRVAYQGKLFGDVPSYMLPFIFNSGRQKDRDGLGGAKTIRGVLRNRIVGDDFTYGNFELRWIFVRTILLNQNIYLAFSGFTDMGMVTRDYKINRSLVDPIYFQDEREKLHQSIGAGFRIALNENFVVAVDYGLALNKNDGEKGLYINLNWLF